MEALSTILVVTVALEALLLGLLFVPVDFTISARAGTGVRFRARWLFGLVRVGGGALPRKPRCRETRPRSSGRGSPPIRRLLAIEGLVPRAGKFVRELLRSLRLRGGRIAVRAGTGDPATTGELCGVAGPLLLWRPWSPSLHVEFEPEFSEAVFEAEAEGSGRIVPARLLEVVGRFAMSRPGMQAVKVMVWNAGR